MQTIVSVTVIVTLAESLHLLHKIHLMVESTAAAMAYGLLVVGTKTVLVFDMGGGESSVLSKSKSSSILIVISQLLYLYSVAVAITLHVLPLPPSFSSSSSLRHNGRDNNAHKGRQV